jgi:hypothetical protein
MKFIFGWKEPGTPDRGRHARSNPPSSSWRGNSYSSGECYFFPGLVLAARSPSFVSAPNMSAAKHKLGL